jgi:hypothetical protein
MVVGYKNADCISCHFFAQLTAGSSSRLIGRDHRFAEASRQLGLNLTQCPFGVV